MRHLSSYHRSAQGFSARLLVGSIPGSFATVVVPTKFVQQSLIVRVRHLTVSQMVGQLTFQPLRLTRPPLMCEISFDYSYFDRGFSSPGGRGTGLNEMEALRALPSGLPVSRDSILKEGIFLIPAPPHACPFCERRIQQCPERLGTVMLETHGCKLNQADTQLLCNSRIGNWQRPATVLPASLKTQTCIPPVLNTCTVTHVADRKARQAVRAAKRRNPNGTGRSYRLLCTARAGRSALDARN